jgi:hypothetical protein
MIACVILPVQTINLSDPSLIDDRIVGRDGGNEAPYHRSVRLVRGCREAKRNGGGVVDYWEDPMRNLVIHLFYYLLMTISGLWREEEMGGETSDDASCAQRSRALLFPTRTIRCEWLTECC